ncbi:MAG: hypothetical protein HN811_08310, partial [Phycisphaerae bacterium]|nr:hypothetical protein [Phycisphaerae bacterium]
KADDSAAWDRISFVGVLSLHAVKSDDVRRVAVSSEVGRVMVFIGYLQRQRRRRDLQLGLDSEMRLARVYDEALLRPRFVNTKGDEVLFVSSVRVLDVGKYHGS